MATSYYKLDIEIRESVGKKSTKAIRRDGKIPSTLYFKGDEPESIAIDKIKLYQALKSDQRVYEVCLLYTSPSPRDQRGSRMPSSA